jgi:outer membrane lipoprotein-sorting protein
MKHIIIISLLFMFISKTQAQQDPEARVILDRVAEKTKNYSTIQADFELIVENIRDKKESKSSGSIKIKGNKYYIETMGSKVFFDGKTMWSYLEDLKEVNISIPDTGKEDFVENPSKIFTFYNRDYKYQLVGDVKIDNVVMYEIDLFPKNLDQPYSRFKLFIHHDTDDLYKVTAVGKEGINYSAYIKNARYNEPLDDDFFTFKPEKHKGVEINDMRF